MTRAEIYDKQQQQIIVNEAHRRIENSKNIWLVVGIIQIIFGGVMFCTLYGIPLLVMGAISLVHSHGINEKQAGYKLSPRRMYVDYSHTQTGLILSIIFNLLLGGVFSVIAPIYEMFVGNYIVSHEYDLGR